MSIQFGNQLGHSVLLSRVTVPKDGCGRKQQGSSGSETILLLSLSAFPVPENHDILEEVFFWQLKLELWSIYF